MNEDLRKIHNFCFRNLELLLKSEKIVCMSCLKTFKTKDISQFTYIQELTGSCEKTGVCECGIDALIPEYIPELEIKISPELLITLHNEFFE